MYSKEKEIIVLFSGGIGSTLNAYWFKLNGYTNVKLLFTDTNSECPDLYRFIAECKDFLGFPMITIKDGRDIWEVFKDSKFMGNSRIDPCSRILKREQTAKFLKNVDHNSSTLCFGIDLFEEERLIKLKRRYEPFEVISPLCDLFLDRVSFESDFYKESGIAKPYLYTIGMLHNNCGGFCVKAGLGHFKKLYEKDLERYLYFEQKEREVYQSVPNARPFLKKNINKVTTYLTLEDYRVNYLENKSSTPDEEESFIGCISCSVL